MDNIGWFIATMHQLIGHDTTARYLGVPPGDKAECLICRYESKPTAEARQAVIDALTKRDGV